MPKLNKGRVRTFFVLNAPSSVKYLWATVRYFVDENTQNKVQFSSTNILPDLLKLVAPEQLEEKFGGTAKNREPSEFWPPSMPSNNYGEKDIDTSCLSVDNTELLKMSVISQSENPMTEEQAQEMYQQVMEQDKGTQNQWSLNK